MTPHYADDWLTVYQGDARTVLATLPAESVDCCVTSPPFWGLRDYGTATWIGGEEGCDHSAGSHAWATATEQAKKRAGGSMPFRGVCGRCGASRTDSQLGLEATPEEYVANLVAVFREVRRVLKATGTLWLNLGDSYTSIGRTGRKESPGVGATQEMGRVEREVKWQAGGGHNFSWTLPGGQKPKDLVGIPWRVAFALQADGWYLRSDIIWAKPNPMPESVTDRPTKSHEYVFLLSKNARYYYDADAVREAQATDEATFYAKLIKQPHKGQRGKDDVNDRHTTAGFAEATYNPAGRNLRSVWTIATRPYPGAHFAVFPPELPERCIKAGSSERGVCPVCGKPWERVVRVTAPDGRSVEKPASQRFAESNGHPLAGDKRIDIGTRAAWSGTLLRSDHVGWQPSCRHETLKAEPATILDPFAGSGTVGLVANRLSRRAILIDLNAAYLEQQMQRNAQVPVGL